MRRNAALIAVFVALGTLSPSALAQEYPPPAANPPPAAPPPATSSDNTGVHAAHALLDQSPQVRSDQLSLWVGLPFAWGLGLDLGVRFSLPLVQNGFIPRLNNSFDLEFGGDLAYYFDAGYLGSGYSLVIPYGEVAARWTFYILPKLAAYAKLGLGIGYEIWGYSTLNSVYVSVPASVGIIYWVAPKFALRAEAGGGWDYYGLRVGVGFDL